MSRSPNRNDYLPPIKTSYEESYGSPRGNQMMPFRRTDSGFNSERIVEFENRLDLQERTTQQLLDKAIQIKKDLIENLNYTQGTWQEEKEARELLQEHIRTITALIRQLNKDVKTVELQIKEKENVLLGTTNVVRQIESSQVSSISDLRGRVGRCDSAIAKLANDMRLISDSIRNVGGESRDSVTKIQEKIQSIEIKNHDTNNRIDRLSSESNSNIRFSIDDLIKQLNDLDNRTKLAIDELRHHTNTIHVFDQSEREKLETKMVLNFEKNFALLQNRLEKLENVQGGPDRHQSVFLDRLENFESEFRNFRSERITFEKELEKRLTLHSDRLYRQHTDDMVRFKREIRDGFAAIHETINNMKSVVEGKQRILEENLRKEMAQLRKMVVLI